MPWLDTAPIYTDQSPFIAAAKSMGYTEHQMRLGEYQELGAWFMDFCWTELCVRAGVQKDWVAYKAVPNETYHFFWQNLKAPVSAEKWKVASSVKQDAGDGNVVETAAAWFLASKDVNAIQKLLLSVMQVDPDFKKVLDSDSGVETIRYNRHSSAGNKIPTGYRWLPCFAAHPPPATTE